MPIDPSSTIRSDFAIVLPEVVLACAAMALLMLGVFRGDRSTGLVSFLSVLTLAVVALLILALPEGRNAAFQATFVADAFARYLKLLMLLGSALVIWMSQNYLRDESLQKFEFPLLMLIATLGMSMMISANSLLTLYMGLELQSLALYVLAAFNRDSLRATESGLKYFVLGALSSGMALYGCSLIYGFTGSADFDVIRNALEGEDYSIGLIIGLVFLAAAMAFKVSAVPFHMWTPDVYEGAPTPVTAFFAAAPKVAAIGLFVRLFMTPFSDESLVPQWQQIIIVISLLSMILGAFAAVGQTNIKRLMAYSSIGHMGYALVGLAAGTQSGIFGVLIYMLIYMLTTVGVFACILAMRRDGRMVEDIHELSGLSRAQPVMALGLFLLLFSLAGIPPLAGFFAKFFVFRAAVEEGLYILAIVGVLASVVSAFYYLRIVKIMYVDEGDKPLEPMAANLKFVLVGASLFTFPVYLLLGYQLTIWTELAAASLF